jgi:hypothetical protein
MTPASISVCPIPQRPIAPFVLPSAAFAAFDCVARIARLASLTESPRGPEEVGVLAIWFDGILQDAGNEAERTELLSGCPDFFGGSSGRALVAWLHESGGFAVEGGRRLTPVESMN